MIQFGRIYSSLRGSRPSSYMDISLGQLRSINVNFVGEVKYPGVYPIHPFSTLITGLIQSGGVDTTGSLRAIEIKRDNKVVNRIDLYDYFLKGELSADIQLRDQDIVYVPTRLSTVKVDSSVFRPAIFESKDGESIKDLISFLGWEWDDSYLKHHLNRRSVTTASLVQVRSPINSKSIGLGKNYKEILKPAIEIMTKYDRYRDLSG